MQTHEGSQEAECKEIVVFRKRVAHLSDGLGCGWWLELLGSGRAPLGGAHQLASLGGCLLRELRGPHFSLPLLCSRGLGGMELPSEALDLKIVRMLMFEMECPTSRM